MQHQYVARSRTQPERKAPVRLAVSVGGASTNRLADSLSTIEIREDIEEKPKKDSTGLDGLPEELKAELLIMCKRFGLIIKRVTAKPIQERSTRLLYVIGGDPTEHLFRLRGRSGHQTLLVEMTIQKRADIIALYSQFQRAFG